MTTLSASQETFDKHRREYADWLTDAVPADVALRPTTVGGVNAQAIDVDGLEATGTLLYLHGGGYSVGTARTGVRLALALSRRARLTSYSLDYRLAPEHPFPAATDDALTAYRSLLEQGIDPSKIILGGDSAGGGLAIATMIAARDAGLPQPAAGFAFSPWVDLTLSGASMETKRDRDPIFDRADLQAYAARYVSGSEAGAPLTSPIFASLHGLPPLLLQVGSYELLLDDAVRLAAAAATADVDVTLEVTSRATHVFQLGVGDAPAADAALDRAAHFLTRHLSAD